MSPPERTAGIFLRRLGRLLASREDHLPRLNANGRRFFDRAIVATYLDCIDYGAGPDAVRLISRYGYTGARR